MISVLMYVAGNQSKACPRVVEVVPTPTDVVLIERGRKRWQKQIRAINKFMPWVDRIVVVHIQNSKFEPQRLPTAESTTSRIPTTVVVSTESDI